MTEENKYHPMYRILAPRGKNDRFREEVERGFIVAWLRATAAKHRRSLRLAAKDDPDRIAFKHHNDALLWAAEAIEEGIHHDKEGPETTPRTRMLRVPMPCPLPPLKGSERITPHNY